MNKIISTLYVLIVLTLCSTVEAKTVVYAGHERVSYHLILLKHIFSYFPEKNYRLKAFGDYIPKNRSFILMANNDGIDVMIGTSTKERERLYLPIRFPILKGLNGWRLALINKNSPDIFKKIKTTKDFKKLQPGQFHTWTDTTILESNNIKVIKGSNFDGIFRMLDKNRIDYFPRSILEAHWDVGARSELSIMVDEHILIKYPMAYYFYVHKENKALANDIKLGLEMALEDGKFDMIFEEFYGDAIRKANIGSRQVFNLKNPFLLESTPIERKELWLSVNN